VTTMTQHAAGMFCWAQVGTTDPEAAKNFYGGLFGWTYEDHDVQGMTITTIKKNGRDVGNLYRLSPEQKAGDQPSWIPFVAVDSADATATQVEASGGKVLMKPNDVDDKGRFAFCQDPTTAFFSLWQARNKPGAGIVNEPGSMCWNELITDDAKKAGAFYSKVFGWTGKPKPNPRVEYTVFSKDGAEVAGMIQATPEMHLTHPYWMTYFAVEDCDASAAKVRQLGGKVQMEPTDIPEIGRFAVVTDPQGAWFSIIAMKDGRT